mmetsp:Transcript_5272/g.3032  ORF Transcript_5272/g.3032 Transcript_5272/m.3032 type:complete len:81 (+) Transcript_5272:585-827(+)
MPPEKKLIELNKETRRRHDNLDNYSNKSLENIEQIVMTIQEGLLDLSEKIGDSTKEVAKKKESGEDLERWRLEKQSYYEE